MEAGKLPGLLIVAVEGLIPRDSCVIIVGPYKGNDATGLTSAMVVWCERDVVPLKICVSVLSP
jgi:hypothetical protein